MQLRYVLPEREMSVLGYTISMTLGPTGQMGSRRDLLAPGRSGAGRPAAF
jgi:hypothetical protein